MEEDKDKSKKEIKTGLMSVFRVGLGRTLLFWFIFLSLLPFTIVSFVSYQNAADSLFESVSKSLTSEVHSRTAFINSYFNRIKDDLRLQSEGTNNVRFLQELQSAFKDSGKTPGEFIKSYRARIIYDKYDSDLKSFYKTYGNYDVFLIDSEGNILFTIMEEDDIGTNLFIGKYSDTLFGIAARKAFETGQTTFSDFESYAPSQNDVNSFLVDIILDDYGDKIGLIAMQISLDKIDNIMHLTSGLYETEDTYLLGKDLKMRSNSTLTDDKTVLEQVVDTEQSRNWLLHLETGKEPQIKSIYTGYRGNKVIGAHEHIEIIGVSFGVIAEIDEAEALAPAVHLRNRALGIGLATMLVLIFAALLLSRTITTPIRNLTKATEQMAGGDLTVRTDVRTRDEIGALGTAFNSMTSIMKDVARQANVIASGDYTADISPRSNNDELGIALQSMTRKLRMARDENSEQDWLKTGIAGLSDVIRGEKEISTLSRDIITYLAEYLDARIGAIFLADEKRHLEIAGRYAYEKHEEVPDRFAFGEGLVGQAAVDGKMTLITDVPDNYITVGSALGQMPPRNIIVLPFLFENQIRGVIELGSLDDFSSLQMKLLNQTGEIIAIAVNAARSRTQLKELLENAQEQAIKLQSQQKELKVSNEELEEKTHELQASEEELRSQQEELQVTNEELEEQTLALETQKMEVIEKNKDLLSTQENLEQKAKELEITGKYKSEFLANMSHELRTPLNSLLVLAQYLISNKDNNLNKEQIEAADIIQSSGEDLLKLIDEILDLSKIEAGKMTVNIEKVVLSELMEGININFKHLTDKRGLELSTTTEKGLPESIMTDRQRLDQIIRNLTSNAIKFTSKGSIRVNFHRPVHDTELSRSRLDPLRSIAISVIDTGIGIPEDRQSDIFEAFQQIDGSTSRQYGGTGLGLSISRELVKLLEGEIQLTSSEGNGSTFTLYLPEDLPKVLDDETMTGKLQSSSITTSDSGPQPGASPTRSIKDDRKDIRENERVLLVIEDDLNFAEVLYKFSHERNFKCLHAGDGETGLKLSLEYKPDAIILDMELPGIKGWDVLETLKSSPMTRHIPVHIMSVTDETVDAYKSGAMGYIRKPVSMEQIQQTFTKFEDLISRKLKNLLIVEDNDVLRKHIKELVGNGDVKTFEVANGIDAIEAVKSNNYDCIILDLSLPDISGFEVLKKLDESEGVTIPPVIIYTGRDLTHEEEYKLQEYASSIIIKGVRSEERLLDETALFLHRVVDNLPQKKKEIITRLYDVESIFKDKKILLADDDMRNVFAISKVLEAKGMNVLKAADGQKALDILNDEPAIDLVLMDIMMPVIDGYEAIKRIRSQERFKKLPVLAITAKAMKDDYEKCIAAGANDYMSKPIKIEKLLSLMRVWLYR